MDAYHKWWLSLNDHERAVVDASGMEDLFYAGVYDIHGVTNALWDAGMIARINGQTEVDLSDEDEFDNILMRH